MFAKFHFLSYRVNSHFSDANTILHHRRRRLLAGGRLRAVATAAPWVIDKFSPPEVDNPLAISGDTFY